MSATSRRRPAALVAAAAALVVLMASPSWPGNRIDTSDGKTFKVIVPIDVFHDDPSVAKKWTKAITDYWNDGPGLGKRWTYCGRPVEFVPDIQVKPKGAKKRDDAHRIDVRLIPPGVDFTSNVKRRGGKFDPANNSTGVWGSTEDNATIAHEFGHLLGLGDEYEVISENPRRTRPLPGFEDSLMAEPKGEVNQGLIDKAMINNKADCEVWEGTWKGHHRTTSVVSRDSGEVRLTVAPDGSVTGGGSILQVTEGGSARHEITATGTRQEDAFHLTWTGPGGTIDIVAPIRGTTAQGTQTVGAGGATYTGTFMLECVSCEEAVG